MNASGPTAYTIRGVDSMPAESASPLHLAPLKDKAILVKSLVNIDNLLHFPMALSDFKTVFVINVNPVSPGILRRKTGRISRTHDVGDVDATVINRDDPDTRAETKVAASPYKPELLDCRTYGFGNSIRLLHGTALQQQPEFVAPQPGDRVPCSYLVFQ